MAVCESVGCLWRIEDDVLRVTKDPDVPEGRGPSSGRAESPSAAKLDEPIDMELRDADLHQTLAAFASITGLEVEVDDALDGRVTIHLQDTPVRQALDAVCDVQDCHWELVETEDGPVLRFSPR